MSYRVYGDAGQWTAGSLIGREVELTQDVSGCLHWPSSRKGYRTTIRDAFRAGNGDGNVSLTVILADGQSFDGWPACWKLVD